MSTPTLVPPAVTRPGLALATVLTAQLMLILDVTVMNVALPGIQAELGFSPTGLSWVITAYSLVFGGLLLLGGRAGDLFGRRRLFLSGVAVFTAASLLGGLADSAFWLVAARVLQGVGAAAAGPSTLALITTTFTEPAARTRALALFTSVASGGFALGLLVGGLLTDWFSWRAALYINVPVGIAVCLLAARFVIEPPRNRARLDLPGALLATLGIGALVYGFNHAASDGWASAVTVLSLAGGVVLLGAFVLVELRTKQPLMPLALFGDRDRAAAYLNFFFGPMAMMSMFYFLTQFMQELSGFGPLATGFAFLPMAGAVFGLSRFVPRLLPRFGPKAMAVTGCLLMIAGLAWLTRLTPDTAYFPGLFGPLLLMGLGAGTAFTPLNVIIMASVRPQDAGAAGGVLQTMQQLGSTVGLAVLVTVFGVVSRDTTGDPAEVLTAGMTAAFTAAAIIATGTLLVALTFRRKAVTASRPPASSR
ncbi:MFS transporter [Amycolatopsis magusensis]|uniref:EmrB/QacA subfamily drug resistance transporter n=1 Tax=Amycolatopsis magusensis TaxID=882444 RepID=A0ABS4Q2R1_9PSEU|nr:MFS transporter [Amycolatopsis magusensis]MBP2185970.1 EmrB/QacA subfamily drug resistance transporter [Amycolatopsis magusensis]